ncbi:MAG: enoyl-CoA hydratase/isomerase family protein [Mycolicibacterium cosmeticum]|nr:enoyl-CoA hydratase/isomerase family protein [Mycolicibacterium cosmeticum]
MKAPPIDTDLVWLDIKGGVATITLDSPHNRNALSSRLRRDLTRHLQTVDADESVRTIILTHSGPVFCSGADLSEAHDGDPQQATQELIGILTALLGAGTPVIAKFAGPARAGGIGLIAACDFAVAAPEVTFAFSEVRIGVVPSIISVPLRLRVAPVALQRLFLTGETFDAARAAEINLISDVCPAADLDNRVADLAEQLRLGAPSALSGAKRLLQPSPEVLRRQFAEMGELSARYFASPDAKEGVRAFLERRPTQWATSPAAGTTPTSIR